MQRRYQKIIEEAPSPAVSAELREEICTAAMTIAKHIGYESAGTVEFLLDQDTERFYFLEMNTRIQVEHPVTEQITGVDIVKEQIRVAAHRPLSFSQEKIRLTGHAIECRINAEAPWEGFRPCAGQIEHWVPPQGPSIRTDTHCYTGYLVSPYYDSLLAKVITTGADRLSAIEHMQCALKNFVVSGVDTTIPFLQSVLDEPDYMEGQVNTRWIEDVFFKREKQYK
jgi:acetyl-CoA carboxylase biotin carboxylase subunit